MKRNLAIALFALSTLGTAASVLAQTPAIQADVPFQFTVGGKQLPAATYTITSTSPGVVQIQSADKRFSAETVAYTGNQQSTDGSKLAFEKYGNQYFLHDVLCPANSTLNVHLPKSGRERRAETEQAKLGDGGEQIFIAAK